MSYLRVKEKVDRPLHSMQTKDGLYSETQVTNLLGEPLYLVDRNHNRVRLLPENEKMFSRNLHVEIISRHIIGPKKYNDYPRVEDWKGEVDKITIPLQVLQKKSVYVAELDVVVALEAFLSGAVHPQNAAYRQQYLRKLERELSEQFNNAPYVILANDPTDKVERLWMDINGFLCELSVSNNHDEPSHFTVGIRDSGSLNGYRYMELNMQDILDGKIEHTCDGMPLYVAVHKAHLAEHIRKRILINEGKFDEELFEKRVQEIEAKYRAELKSLKEDNVRLIKDKERISQDKDRIIDQLTAQLREYQDLIQIRHSQEKMELERRKMESEENVAREKQRQDGRRYEHEKELAALKASKENYSFQAARTANTASNLKAAAVIVPIIAVGAAAVSGWVTAPASALVGLFSII